MFLISQKTNNKIAPNVSSIYSAIALAKKSIEEERDRVPRTTITVPYVAGACEKIRRICSIFDIIAFRTARSVHSKLTKVTDLLPLEKQSIMVYRVPCSCGQSFTGKTI